MAYQFYFDGAEIPITPGDITFKYEGNNKTYTLIDEGEINVLKLPSLQEITFDVLLPTQVYPFANNEETSPSTWLDTFESYQQNKTPFQFVIVRTTDVGEVYHGTSVRCALESYEVKESANDYGTDVNVSVTLKEYKDYGTKTVVIKSGSASATEKREQDNAPTTPATVDTDKADNPVVMAKTYNNTSSTAPKISSDNGYGSTGDDGSYKKEYRDYGKGTSAGSDNAAYIQNNKDKAASKSKITVPKTSAGILAKAQKDATAKTGYTTKSTSKSTTLPSATTMANNLINKRTTTSNSGRELLNLVQSKK